MIHPTQHISCHPELDSGSIKFVINTDPSSWSFPRRGKHLGHPIPTPSNTRLRLGIQVHKARTSPVHFAPSREGSIVSPRSTYISHPELDSGSLNSLIAL